MPTIIDCPSCGRKLRVADDLQSLKAKCPTCQSTFALPAAEEQVPVPAAVPPVPVERVIELSLDGPSEPAAKPIPQPGAAPQPMAVRSAGTRRCPYCREDILSDATWCRHCGEELDHEDEARPPWQRKGGLRRDCEPHRGGLLLTLGIIGIIAAVIPYFTIFGVPISIVAWIMAQRDLNQMRANVMDPQGLGVAQTARICAIIGTCMGVLWWTLGLLFLGMYWSRW